VLLYIATKDRWRWRLFVRRLTLSSLCLLIIAGVSAAGFYLWGHIPQPITLQAQYAGLKIGSSPAEVNYIKGTPSSVLGEMSNEPGMEGWQRVIEVSKIEKDKTIQDYRDWDWDSGTSRLDVTFDPTMRALIVIQCYSNDRLRRCPEIAGIADGATEDEVIKRFGEPESSEITGVTKRLNYPKYGTFFLLEKQTVYSLGIHDPHWAKK
jgi:hypothetical protein